MRKVACIEIDNGNNPCHTPFMRVPCMNSVHGLVPYIEIVHVNLSKFQAVE